MASWSKFRHLFFVLFSTHKVESLYRESTKKKGDLVDFRRCCVLRERDELIGKTFVCHVLEIVILAGPPSSSKCPLFCCFLCAFQNRKLVFFCFRVNWTPPYRKHGFWRYFYRRLFYQPTFHWFFFFYSKFWLILFISSIHTFNFPHFSKMFMGSVVITAARCPTIVLKSKKK